MLFFSKTDDSSYAKRLQTQLVDIYSTTEEHRFRFHPGFTSEKISLSEHCINLKLAQCQKSPTVNYVEFETYSDLLRLQDSRDKRSLKHVLVSGEACVGKTTVITGLAYQWATGKQKRLRSDKFSFVRKLKQNQKQSLHKFEYVFVLDLHKCETDTCLVDVIERQLLPNVSKDHLEQFLKNRASDCLYLFDGYGEVGTNDKVLKSNLLYDSHVIVTSRPSEIGQFYESYKEYAHVIAKGFSDVTIGKFVKLSLSVLKRFRTNY